MTKVSTKDKNMLIGVLGILIVVVVWFLIVSPMQDELTAIESENATLSKKAANYQAIMGRLDDYEAGIINANVTIDEISDRYPVLVSTEDQMMFWANIDTSLPLELRFGDLEIKEIDDAVSVAGIDPESLKNIDVFTNENGEDTLLDSQIDDISAKYKLFGAPMAMNFACTYNGFKYMLDYITSQYNKNSIIGIEMNYDAETGYLSGAIGVELYYIEGLEKEYTPAFVPSVPKGLSDVFHTGATTVTLFSGDPSEAPADALETDATTNEEITE